MKSIFTEVSEMAQKINSLGKPQEGVAYIIAAVDTKEESKANTTIAVAGKGADVMTLVKCMLKEGNLGMAIKQIQTIEALEKLKELIDMKPSDTPKDKAAAASETKLS